MLRDYQQRAIDMLYKWFEGNPSGNPCLELPTGSGKSWIIAALCRDALQSWPETRVLMLTHVKELIEQNAAQMRKVWPNAPLGIYSASVGRKQLGEPITFGGIQSLRGKARILGHIDLVLVDECHLIGHEAQGGYRQLIADLSAINPHLRVIGLTATPYRLGHGYITDPPAIFDAIISPTSIEELLAKGNLAPLRSKVTGARLDVTGVAKRGGEFVEAALQAAVDTDEQNRAVVSEMIERAEGRRWWIVFCAGVHHAEAIAEGLRERGIEAACITGATPKQERQELIRRFKRGELRALTNANVLTTGFDHPDVDLVAFLRPTLSPVLYVQMAGRGMRPKSHTDHCLVLDFAGNVARHGPITAVQPPNKSKKGEGEAPSKVCPDCGEICAASVRTCPACGFGFPPPEPKRLELRHDDIMGREGIEMDVREWRWLEHTSRSSGMPMLRLSYLGHALSDPIVDEYLPIHNGGYAEQRAMMSLAALAGKSKAQVNSIGAATDAEIVAAMNAATPPSRIKFMRDGKFFRVTERTWDEQER
jgi:DNA repair protein RadD